MKIRLMQRYTRHAPARDCFAWWLQINSTGLKGHAVLQVTVCYN